MSTALDRVADRAAPAPLHLGQATAVEQARAVAEVQAAVTVAQQCPRDMRRAWAEMKAACGRLTLAERAFYKVPNRGAGPSVHLARELARIWGNLDYGVRELRRDDARGESEIQAFAWDQQVNVRSTRSLISPHARMAGGERRPLVDLTDIYLSNQNVGARAVRECIFTVLPADFVDEAQEICRATIKNGDGEPIDTRIAKVVAKFGEMGVTVQRIEARLEGRKRGQWNAADLAELSIIFYSLRRGETTVEAEFPIARVSNDEILGYKPDPDAAIKAAAFPGYVDPSILVAPEHADGDWPAVAEPGGEA